MHTPSGTQSNGRPSLQTKSPSLDVMLEAQKNILLVDDDSDQLMLFSLLLHGAGYNVLTADSVRKALGLLKTRSIQLVITDICMPGIDGERFVHILRNSRRSARLPIIALTATRTDIEEQVLEAHGPDMLCMKDKALALLLSQVEFLLA